MNWYDLFLGIALLGIAAYNLNNPIYDRYYFHRSPDRREPPWRDAGPISRAARVWISALVLLCGLMLLRFAVIA